VLFDGTGSNSLAVTVTVLVIDLAAVGVTATVTVRLAPLRSWPQLQMTVTVPVQLPWVVEADPKITLTGSVSVTRTPVAVNGPLLVTVTV
jgi:hypothetical protein